MPRFVVQSKVTGRFLCPSPTDGTPEWVRELREAGGGVVTDFETALELVHEWSEMDEPVVVVDLDRLGTANDYTEGTR
ncbi:hypothetical protein CY658_02890 [Variovorax sp. RO1]|uniref:hypothetical protein n=1 Tax=Variovorax sp. RO1 TaxID=2066034 RepID=UPI000C716F22|nr:hypothetical protein [Variovorax sp. RO1]PLC06013.1 hypothetical protein CY658_02890 [Variovorax sp. RO1]